MGGSKGKNHWNDKWVDKTDSNGDKVGSYLEKISEFSVKCKMCVREFGTASMGYSAISRHFQGDEHKRIANLRRNQNNTQAAVLQNPSDDEAAVDDPDIVAAGGNVGDGEPRQMPSSSSSNQNISRYFRSAPRPTAVVVENNNVTVFTLTEKVAKAEILLILQSVFKNYSLRSLDSLVIVQQIAFSDSKIASKMSLGRTKAQYSLTEAIAPFFLKETLKDIKRSDTFVLGLDTATTKALGLSKGLDLKVRYYSEKHKKVTDVYLTTVNLGHETADILVNVTLEELNKAGLDVRKLLVISRDNPNVMKSFNKKLEDIVLDQGNPKLFESPCVLHPTHTSFKKGIEKLSMEVDKFLLNVHGWFKLSTARREDFVDLRIKLQIEDENVWDFFLRHVATRWLTMKLVIARIIEHWKSLTHYFVEYLPKSSEPSHKEAVKSDRYEKIIKVLKPAENKSNLARLKFVGYLCSKTETYLKTFQSEKPLSYKLHSDCCLLISNLMTSVVTAEKIPKTCDGKKFSKFLKRTVDAEGKVKVVFDADVTLSRDRCNFGPVVASAISECREDAQSKLKKEFKDATVAMIKYLIEHLPLNDTFLKDLSFSNPNMLDAGDFAPALIRVAKATKRFTNDELQRLDNQLQVLKLSRDLPEYDESKETFDEHWLKKLVGKIKEMMGGEEAYEISKLVKMISIFPNSQAFVERGFNDTKRIADSRQNVSENLMKSTKITLDAVRQAGGPDKVYIGLELIGEHLSAHQTYRERLRKEEKEKENEVATEKRLEEMREKKRKFDEQKEAWDVKVADLKEEIKVLKNTMSLHEENQEKYFKQAEKVKSQAQKASYFKLAKVTAESIKSLRCELDEKQESMSRLMSKKPKSG